MKGGKTPLKLKSQSKGYTIVEVMIVLAVSGVMFAIAANFINGRQAKASFTQGTNEMASRIQATIDQVEDGRFSDIKLLCNVVGGDAAVSTPGDGSAKDQGKNADCVFMGKFMHFSVGGDKQKYETFLLAGKRNSTNLPDAGIKAGGSNVTVSSVVPQGLDVESIKMDGTPVYGLGFVRDPSDGIKVTAVSTTALSATDEQAAAATKLTSANIRSMANTIVLCLTDGTRYGKIILGDGAANLRLKTQLGITRAECIS